MENSPEEGHEETITLLPMRPFRFCAGSTGRRYVCVALGVSPALILFGCSSRKPSVPPDPNNSSSARSVANTRVGRDIYLPLQSRRTEITNRQELSEPHDTKERSTNNVGDEMTGNRAVDAPMLAAVRPEIIRRADTRKLLVALTFDACQTRKPAGYDANIIRILRETNTPATLLLGGRWMEAHPKETQDIGSDPLFELGNHSYLHPHMTRLSQREVRQEIKKTQDIMFRLTGKQGLYFRPPFGEYNDTVLQTAAQLGLKTLMWDCVTGDPDRHVKARYIIHTVATQVRPGSTVIMHMNGRGWHTAEALPTVIRLLRKKGYTFVTLSDLLKEAQP